MKYLRLMLSAFCIASLVGCATSSDKPKAVEKVLVIPDFPSAKEQYQFASVYQRAQIIAPELNRRIVQMDKVIQCYDRVIKLFPDDPVFAPLSRLAIADCTRGQDNYTGAIQMYQQVAKDFPTNEMVQARALFSIGRCYDLQLKYQEAKDTYHKVITDFSSSERPDVRDTVKRAKYLYMQVREEPKQQKGKLLKQPK